MRDTMKPFRHAIYDVLTGVITYNGGVVGVYDSKVFTGETPLTYILLGSQTESNTEGNDCTWITRSTIEIEIVSRSGSEVSKDVMDDISNEVSELIATLPGVSTISQPSGLQILNIYRESASTREIDISQTQSILRKIIKFTATINQQN